MSGLTLILLVLLVASALTLPVRTVWRRRARLRPRREFYTSLWIEEERIVAEGVFDPAMIVFDHVICSVNGNDIEMVVMEVDPVRGRWAAQDLVSLRRANQLVGR